MPQTSIDLVDQGGGGRGNPLSSLVGRRRAPKQAAGAASSDDDEEEEGGSERGEGAGLARMMSLLHSTMFSEQGEKLKWIKTRITR